VGQFSSPRDFSNNVETYFTILSSIRISSTMTGSNCCILALAILLVTSTVSGCYVGYPAISQCGSVGQLTTLSTVYALNFSATGWIDWGDGSPVEGFVATNETSTGQYEVKFADDENQLIFEHVYANAGTYSIAIETTLHLGQTVNETNWCIIDRVPDLGNEWLLTISENDCQEEFRITSAAKATSIALLIFATLASFIYL
jgi:hypothetical protein